MREGAITPQQFVGNGFPQERMAQILEWNRQHGVDTVTGLNESVRSRRIKGVIEASLAQYEASLDEAAQKVVTRLNAGDKLRMMWVSGPSPPARRRPR